MCFKCIIARVAVRTSELQAPACMFLAEERYICFVIGSKQYLALMFLHK